MNQEQINRIRNLVKEWRSVADGTLTYADRQGITTHAILAECGQLARCARELEECLDEHPAMLSDAAVIVNTPTVE